MGRKVGTGSLKAVIVILCWTAPLSTDLCLPSLPTIASDMGATQEQASLVLIGFFFFMALSMLVSGPLSDLKGRRVVLLASQAIFLAGNVGCALAPNLASLVAFRCIAACGAGGIMSSSTALIRDCFVGRERDETLALTQMFMNIAPLCAPFIGSLLVMHASWRVGFGLIAIVELIAVVMSFGNEGIRALPSGGEGDLAGSLKGLVPVFVDGDVLLPLASSGLAHAVFLAYIGASSYIYLNQFQLSEIQYSFFFAASALISTLGPKIFLALRRRAPLRSLLLACLGVIACLGVFISALAQTGPWAFFLLWMPTATVVSIIGPLLTSHILELPKHEAGSLSAVTNFTRWSLGLIGLALGSISWSNQAGALGLIAALLACVAAVPAVTCAPRFAETPNGMI